MKEMKAKVENIGARMKLNGYAYLQMTLCFWQIVKGNFKEWLMKFTWCV